MNERSPPAGRPRHGAPLRGDGLVLFAIVFLAFVLRLVGLGRESLWYDEAFTLSYARRSLGAMFDFLVPLAWDPPVYPTTVWTWVRLCGLGDWQVRLVSAIFGTLAVLALHGLARRLFDLRTAHLAAFLGAVSQFLVAYSQEVRCYAVLLFFTLATVNLFVDAVREGGMGRRSIAFVLLAAIATLTHYYAVFLLFALALFAMLFRARRPIPIRRVVLGLLVYALLLAPWFASGVIPAAAGQRIAHFEHAAPWFSVDPWTFLRTMDDFHGGRMEGMLAAAPKWTYLVGAVLFGFPALCALRPIVSRSAPAAEKEGPALLALLWLVPMACLIALGFANIQFATRYVLFCAPPYLVLVARGLVSMRPVPRRVFFAGIAVWTVLSLRALYGIPHKEDWRGALFELSQEYRRGDGVLFLPFGEVPLAWPVYHPDGPELEVVGLDGVADAACDRLWVLTYERVRVDDPRADRARELLRRRKKVRESTYFLVRVEQYSAPQGMR